jgi:hypothetical protein
MILAEIFFADVLYQLKEVIPHFPNILGIFISRFGFVMSRFEFFMAFME